MPGTDYTAVARRTTTSALIKAYTNLDALFAFVGDRAGTAEDIAHRIEVAVPAIEAEIDSRIPVPVDAEPPEIYGPVSDGYPTCSRKHTAPRAPDGARCEAVIRPYNWGRPPIPEPCDRTGDLVRVGDRNLCEAHAWCRVCQRPFAVESSPTT